MNSSSAYPPPLAPPPPPLSQGNSRAFSHVCWSGAENNLIDTLVILVSHVAEDDVVSLFISSSVVQI